jgi:hypothetical protein
VPFDDAPPTVTSHLWLTLDPAGADAQAAEDAARDDGGGCAVIARERGSETPAWALVATGLALAGLAVVRQRRRR